MHYHAGYREFTVYWLPSGPEKNKSLSRILTQRKTKTSNPLLSSRSQEVDISRGLNVSHPLWDHPRKVQITRQKGLVDTTQKVKNGAKSHPFVSTIKSSLASYPLTLSFKPSSLQEKMQRQKSILSFFEKSSPEEDRNASSYTEMLHRSRLRQFPPKQPRPNPPPAAESAAPISKDPLPEVTGTDTPPEKVRRPVFLSRFFADNEAAARPSSAILQKLVKGPGSEASHDRYVFSFMGFILIWLSIVFEGLE